MDLTIHQNSRQVSAIGMVLEVPEVNPLLNVLVIHCHDIDVKLFGMSLQQIYDLGNRILQVADYMTDQTIGIAARCGGDERVVAHVEEILNEPSQQ